MTTNLNEITLGDIVTLVGAIASLFAVIVVAIFFMFNKFYGFKQWIDEVDLDREAFKEFMKEIRDDIKKIFIAIPPSPLGSNSPLQLTDLGNDISKSLDAEGWAQKIVVSESLVKRVKGKKPFEIQEFCIKFVDELNNEDSVKWDRLIREEAYVRGITEKDVIGVLVTVLRNELLEGR